MSLEVPHQRRTESINTRANPMSERVSQAANIPRQGREEKLQVNVDQLQNIMPSFKSKPKTVDFDRIKTLFTHKHALKLTSRQIDVIQKLTAIYQDGIPLEDISNINQVLKVTLKVLKRGNRELIPSMIEFLQVLSLIPNMKGQESPIKLVLLPTKVFYRLMADVSELLSVLSELAKVILVKDFLLDALQLIYRLTGGSEATLSENNTVKIHFPNYMLNPKQVVIEQGSGESSDRDSPLYLQAAEKRFAEVDGSDVLVHLLDTLEIVTDSKSKIGLLRCIRRLSVSSSLCETLAKDFANDVIFFLTMEILWNILDEQTGVPAAAYLGNAQQLDGMQKLLLQCATSCIRQIEKQKRNEVLVILCRIAEFNHSSMPIFKELGIHKLIFELMTAQELFIPIPIIDKNSITNDNDDFEFKRLLVLMTKILCSDEECRDYMVKHGLIDFCVIYFGAGKDNMGYKCWSVVQRSILQTQILSLTIDLIPTAIKMFASIDGPFFVVELLHSLIEYKAQIEPDRVDLIRVHNSLMETCLLLLTTLSERGPIFKKMLGQFKIFEHLIKILNDNSQSVKIWSKSLIICSSLCHGYKANKDLFGRVGGIIALIKFLSFTSCNQKEWELLILSAVECIWGTVCGNKEYEDEFISLEGIFLLLNLLEIASYGMKQHILGSLLDLLENPKTALHLLEWRTKADTKKGIEHLLIAVWCEEEERIGVRVSDTGILPTTVKFPLLNRNEIPVSQTKVDDTSSAVNEMQGNLRAKIYSMFSKIGFDKFHQTLKTQELIKLTMISKYLDFKVGEVWNEITQELKIQGVRPTSPDLYCLQSIEATVQEKLVAVANRQGAIYDDAIANRNDEEQRFFDQWIKEFIKLPTAVRNPRIHTWKQSLLTKPSQLVKPFK